MVELSSEYKVPGGKMIKVKVHVEGLMIKDVMITGDFFIYPEEAIEGLEAVLKGAMVDEGNILKLIKEYVKEKNVEILGASPEDFATAVAKALKPCNP